jgi:hypothetical protein
MRRNLAERPRVVAAQVLGVLALVLIGALVGTRLADDGEKVPPATANALERARTEARSSRRQLEAATGRARRMEAGRARERRRSAALRRRNRRLRRALTRTRRALTRARRR